MSSVEVADRAESQPAARTALPDPGEQVPKLAWPTVALFLAGALALVAIAYAIGRYEIAWWTADMRTLGRMVGLALAIAAMLYAMSVPGASQIGTAVFGHRATVWIGMVSYSLYLWHLSLIEFVVDHRLAPLRGDASMRDFAVMVAIALPAALAVSAASYYAVERVFLDRTRWPSRAGDASSWMRKPILVVAAWMLALLAAAGIVAAAGVSATR